MFDTPYCRNRITLSCRSVGNYLSYYISRSGNIEQMVHKHAHDAMGTLGGIKYDQTSQ
jgi:hypothetical protein